ncbi:uncharacterized protein LOC130891408 [Diorhabda carinulata]|uniref:uncharacterized protein LOC130444697 n=1 Tax=Diorhabda sublineata TaxID=1163346 RepID=UPI0024E15270|nr:uncharacterized protein LOC130444697 [Diorhabda sublineata]XP_057652120.1 uncharacterized protein LOC130891408 [Diorhabda carinulata]
MNCQVLCVVISGLLLQAAFASPVVDDVKDQHINSVNSEKSTIEESLFKKLNVKCSNQDISSCMMLKLVNYFNRLLKKSYIELGDIEISQTSTETVNVESSRSLNEIEKIPEEEQLYEVLMNKALNFVKTRSLKWKVIDGADLVVAGSSDKDGSLNLGLSLKPNSNGIEEGRKKKSKGGSGIYALLAAAAMKIGLLKALAFKALVLLVGKALLVSKLALVLAVVIGLKKLLSGGEKHVTYEVVAQPHHEHHVEHSHSGGGYDAHGGGGWGRTFDAHAAQNLAYSAHIPSN